MRSGELTGEEYIALNRDYPIQVWGVENWDLYSKNGEQFNRVIKYSSDPQVFLTQVEQAIKALKPLVYNKQLKELEEKEALFNDKKIELNDYLDYLTQTAKKLNLDILNPYTNITLLQNSLNLEKDLKPEKAQEELRLYLTVLTQNLSSKSKTKDLEELTQKSLLFQQEKIAPVKFYSFLKTLGDQNNIPLSTYKNLNSFTEYLEIASKLESYKLYQELTSLLEELKLKACSNQDQKDLITISKNISFLKDFFNLKVSNEELEYFLTHKEEFTVSYFKGKIDETLKGKFQSGNPAFRLSYIDYNPNIIDSKFQELEDFYKVVWERDKAIVDNSLKRMNEFKEDSSILIVGGFHTKGMTKLLRDKNISYIVLSANAEGDMDDQLYHELISGKRKTIVELIPYANEVFRESFRIALMLDEQLKELGIVNPEDRAKLAGQLVAMAVEEGGSKILVLEDGRGIKVTGVGTNTKLSVLTPKEVAELQKARYIQVTAQKEYFDAGGDVYFEKWGYVPGSNNNQICLKADPSIIAKRGKDGRFSVFSGGLQAKSSISLAVAGIIAVTPLETKVETTAALLSKPLSTIQVQQRQVSEKDVLTNAQIEKIVNGMDRWLSKISQTRTGLPPSHVGDTREVAIKHGFATGGFTYDLAHMALRYARTGKFQEARKIIFYFAERFNKYTVEELRGMVDNHNVYGILRLLPGPADGRLRKHIINCIDVSSPWEQGNGIIEWYTDGGPQSWLGMATVQELMFDNGLNSIQRRELEKFAVELAETIMGLFHPENVVSAGPKKQDVYPGEPAREHLGHIENMWDHYKFLNLLAGYLESKNKYPDLVKEYRKKAKSILIGLKNKGALVKEGDIAYFWQGFKNGQINKQIPTDVQAWAIASVGPKKLNEVFGDGTAEGLLNWLIKHSLVLVDYIRPDGYLVTTIGADFSDPHLPDIVGQRYGARPQITDEWNAGVIGAMDVIVMDAMVSYYSEIGKTKEAEDYLAMADALRWFALQRKTETDGIVYWQYSTEPDMATGYGWNTPDAPGGSLAGNQVIFALLGINPFDPSAKSSGAVEGIRRLGVEKGIELLLARMNPENKFSENPVIRPKERPKKVAESRVPWVAKKPEDVGLSLTDPTIFKKISFYSAIGEGAGEIPAPRGVIGVKTVTSWNNIELSFTEYLNLSKIPYLTLKVKASKGANALRINIVDKQYILAQDWSRPPAFVQVEVPGDNEWHTVTVDLRKSWADIENVAAISFEVGTATTGNRIGTEIFIKDFRFIEEKPAPKIEVPKKEIPEQKVVPEPKEEIKVKPQIETIAWGIDGSWSGFGSHSCWKLGPFDLSDAKYIEVTFPLSQAGINVFVRLLPEYASPDQPTGLNRKSYTIPKDGRVLIPISEFPLSKSDLKNIGQISVHSGSNAWNISLDQSEDKRAIFNEIQKVMEEIPAPKKEITPTKPKPTPQAETIAWGIDGTWGDSNAFSCWKLGPFDLSKAKYIQLQFSTNQAGTKVLVRLLPQHASPDQPTGLNRKEYTIPKDGKVLIPISEFPLSESDLKNIDQISVHSGNGTWYIRLDNKGRTATFDKIEIIKEAAKQGYLTPESKEVLLASTETPSWEELFPEQQIVEQDNIIDLIKIAKETRDESLKDKAIRGILQITGIPEIDYKYVDRLIKSEGMLNYEQILEKAEVDAPALIEEISLKTAMYKEAERFIAKGRRIKGYAPSGAYPLSEADLEWGQDLTFDEEGSFAWTLTEILMYIGVPSFKEPDMYRASWSNLFSFGLLTLREKGIIKNIQDLESKEIGSLGWSLLQMAKVAKDGTESVFTYAISQLVWLGFVNAESCAEDLRYEKGSLSDTVAKLSGLVIYYYGPLQSLGEAGIITNKKDLESKEVGSLGWSLLQIANAFEHDPTSFFVTRLPELVRAGIVSKDNVAEDLKYEEGSIGWILVEMANFAKTRDRMLFESLPGFLGEDILQDREYTKQALKSVIDLIKVSGEWVYMVVYCSDLVKEILLNRETGLTNEQLDRRMLDFALEKLGTVREKDEITNHASFIFNKLSADNKEETRDRLFNSIIKTITTTNEEHVFDNYSLILSSMLTNVYMKYVDEKFGREEFLGIDIPSQYQEKALSLLLNVAKGKYPIEFKKIAVKRIGDVIKQTNNIKVTRRDRLLSDIIDYLLSDIIDYGEGGMIRASDVLQEKYDEKKKILSPQLANMLFNIYRDAEASVFKDFVLSVLSDGEILRYLKPAEQQSILNMTIVRIKSIEDRETCVNLIDNFSYVLGSKDIPAQVKTAILDLFFELFEWPETFAFWSSEKYSLEVKTRFRESAGYGLVKTLSEGQIDGDITSHFLELVHRKDELGKFLSSILIANRDNIENELISKEIDQLIFETLPQSLDYERIYRDGKVTIRIYFLSKLFYTDWERWFKEDFEEQSVRLNGKEFVRFTKPATLKDGRKITINIDIPPVSDTEADFKGGVFEAMEARDTDMIIYTGHTGGGAYLALSLAMAPRGEFAINSQVAMLLQDCGSLPNYEAKINTLYPNALTIVTQSTTWEPDRPRVFKEILDGMLNLETGPGIKERLKKLETERPENIYENYVFFHEPIKLAYRDSDKDGITNDRDGVYNLGVSREVITYDDFEFRFTAEEPRQSLTELLFYLNYRFSPNPFLKYFQDIRVPEESADGFRLKGWFRHKEDKPDLFKLPLREFPSEYNTNLNTFEIEVNVGYSQTSLRALKMMAMYELYDYFARHYKIKEIRRVKQAIKRSEPLKEMTPEQHFWAFIKAVEVLSLELHAVGGEEKREALLLLYDKFIERYNLPREIDFDTADKAYWAKEIAGTVRTKETDEALEKVKMTFGVKKKERKSEVGFETPEDTYALPNPDPFIPQYKSFLSGDKRFSPYDLFDPLIHADYPYSDGRIQLLRVNPRNIIIFESNATISDLEQIVNGKTVAKELQRQIEGSILPDGFTVVVEYKGDLDEGRMKEAKKIKEQVKSMAQVTGKQVRLVMINREEFIDREVVFLPGTAVQSASIEHREGTNNDGDVQYATLMAENGINTKESPGASVAFINAITDLLKRGISVKVIASSDDELRQLKTEENIDPKAYKYLESQGVKFETPERNWLDSLTAAQIIYSGNIEDIGGIPVFKVTAPINREIEAGV